MDPFTLLALVSAAGFIFKKSSAQAKFNHENNRKELTYSKDIVSRAKNQEVADFDISAIEVLPEYHLIKALIQNEFPLTFVTGGAGTGKSTLIRWLLSEYDGSVLLTAPTAVAAINIEGKTLHSLCHLPPAWIVKNDIKKDISRREISQAKLLIIDEISMVTANLLDGVSAYFRLNKRVDKPFGGLPVIMIGDMFQLPPVVGKETKHLYEQIYGSAKFYNAKCLGETTYYGIELNKTFRQIDQEFVNILTRIREGIDINECLAFLNSKCLITTTPSEDVVWLSPRNVEVNSRNSFELNKIKSPAKLYRGKISGNYKPDRLPSPIELTLKNNAQVMFTKNDMSKRWINGTVGKVISMDEDNIVVELVKSKTLVDVGRTKWAEFQYKWNDTKNEIERVQTGSYLQFPMILAWAITIHKSQGRTIEKVHIDLGNGAFETGQTYVALSRCRSISGLSLSRPLAHNDILVDNESKDFYYRLRDLISRLPPSEMIKNLEKQKSIDNP